MAVFLNAPRTPAPDNPTPHPRPNLHAVPDYATSPLNTPRPLTASTLKIDTNDAATMNKLRAASSDRSWQRRAWLALDAVGEIHYGFNLMANLISRIRFYPAAEVTPSTSPAAVEDVHDLTPGIATAATQAFNRLAKNGSLAEIARLAILNLLVPGEFYLVQTPASPFPPGNPTPETWQIRSIDEVQVTDEGVRILNTPISTPPTAASYSNPGIISAPRATDQNSTLLPHSAFVARIWKRHPRWNALADSSMVAVLDPVDELLLLNQTFRATARSRLNSGLLFVPDGLAAATPPALPTTTPPTPPTTNPPTPPTPPPTTPPTKTTAQTDADDFEEALLEGMMTPIQDPSGASAVVPILVRGPTELGEKIRYITFERVFDPALVQRADRVLDRILQGIELPKDLVSGLSNVRYSNAVVIEDGLHRSHLAPLILFLCDALSEVYLRPALQAAGFTPEQAQRVRIWYDATEIVARPNRAQDATNAYDRYALSAKALREASGFNEEDAPPPAEIVLRMLYQKGPITPDLAEALMRNIAPLLMESAREAANQNSENPLPPEVQDLLNPSQTQPTSPGGPPPAGQAGSPAIPPEGTPPTPPPDAAPAPNTSGPRPGRPAEAPSSTPSQLPPRQGPNFQ